LGFRGISDWDTLWPDSNKAWHPELSQDTRGREHFADFLGRSHIGDFWVSLPVTATKDYLYSMDIAQRFENNPILRPGDCLPSRDGLEVVCLLNPGVFRYNGRVGLLLRVAERPRQNEDSISFPVINPDALGGIEILEFKKDSPPYRISGLLGVTMVFTLKLSPNLRSLVSGRLNHSVLKTVEWRILMGVIGCHTRQFLPMGLLSPLSALPTGCRSNGMG
jgi:hypothetical protein